MRVFERTRRSRRALPGRPESGHRRLTCERPVAEAVGHDDAAPARARLEAPEIAALALARLSDAQRGEIERRCRWGASPDPAQERRALAGKRVQIELRRLAPHRVEARSAGGHGGMPAPQGRRVGNPWPPVEGQHFDAHGLAALERAEDDLAPPAVLHDVGGRLGDDDADSALLGLVEASGSAHGGDRPAHLSDVTGIRHRHGDRRSHHPVAGRH